jgi:hypothetical protein
MRRVSRNNARPDARAALLVGAVTIVAILGAACGSSSAPSLTAPSSTTTTAIAPQQSGFGTGSGSVLQFWSAHAVDGETSVLDAAILWRGSPGWIFQSGGDGFCGDGSSSSDVAYYRMWDGSYSLEWTLNRGAKSVSILGQSLSIADANVILVDGANSPGGSRIAQTLWMGPYTGQPTQLPPWGRSPDVMAFIQCDVRFADPLQQTIANLLCGRYSGQ